MFVPAGVSALLVSPPAGGLSTSPAPWAVSRPAPAEGSTVLSDFALSSDSAEALCSISGLLAKSMGRLQGGPAGQQADVVQRTRCLYQVEWQLAQAVQLEEFATGTHVWQLPRSRARAPVAAAAAAIEAVQRLLRDGSTTEFVQLQTAGVGLVQAPSPLPASRAGGLLSAAALTGLIKTLSHEAPQITWSADDADGLSVPAGSGRVAQLLRLPASASGAADAFGSMRRGGARLVPALLSSAAEESLGAFHLMPMPRGSLNSLVPQRVDVDRPLSDDEVLVEVKAVGLNFRWVHVQACLPAFPSFQPALSGSRARPPWLCGCVLTLLSCTLQGRAQRAGHVPRRPRPSGRRLRRRGAAWPCEARGPCGRRPW